MIQPPTSNMTREQAIQALANYLKDHYSDPSPCLEIEMQPETKAGYTFSLGIHKFATTPADDKEIKDRLDTSAKNLLGLLGRAGFEQVQLANPKIVTKDQMRR